MHIVRCDTNKNRLNVLLGGVINLEEAHKVREEIFECVGELSPGFDVLNDLSKFIQGEESGGAILQDVTKFLIAKKASRIIRIIGNSKTGLMQFAKYSQLEEPFDIRYVPTMAEAEMILQIQPDNKHKG